MVLRKVVVATLAIVTFGCSSSILPSIDAPILPPINTEAPGSSAPSRTASTMQTAPPSATPAFVQSQGPIVREGDSVTATGQLLEWPGETVICGFPAGGLAGGVGAGGCAGSKFVSVVGPGLDQHIGEWATVTGSWTGTAIEIAHLEGASPIDTGFERIVPCDSPAQGWSPGPIREADSRRVRAFIEARPETFAELTGAYIPAAGSQETDTFVFLISTVADRATTERDLRRRFDANFCVVHVGFNQVDFDRMQAQMGASPGVHSGPPGAALNMTFRGHDFVLELAVLDATAAAILGTEIEGVVIEPFVRKVGTSP
jgi:hypothetical protein